LESSLHSRLQRCTLIAKKKKKTPSKQQNVTCILGL
jgi:hypothetical protein